MSLGKRRLSIINAWNGSLAEIEESVKTLIEDINNHSCIRIEQKANIRAVPLAIRNLIYKISELGKGTTLKDAKDKLMEGLRGINDISKGVSNIFGKGCAGGIKNLEVILTFPPLQIRTIVWEYFKPFINLFNKYLKMNMNENVIQKFNKDFEAFVKNSQSVRDKLAREHYTLSEESVHAFMNILKNNGLKNLETSKKILKETADQCSKAAKDIGEAVELYNELFNKILSSNSEELRKIFLRLDKVKQ